MKIIKDTKNYNLAVVEEPKTGANIYAVVNKEYEVVELMTPVLPEAFNYMEKAQQFFNVNFQTVGSKFGL